MALYHEKTYANFVITYREYNKTSGNIFRDRYGHWHEKMEICLMLGGKCDFVINGKTYSAVKGDVIVIKSGEIHAFNPIHGSCSMYICQFEPMFLYNLRVDIGNIHHHIKAEDMKKYSMHKTILDCFETLYSERELTKKCSEIIFKANILHIYGMLLRNFEKKSEVYKSDISKLISFQRILEYISANYTDNITLESVAEEFGYNPVYLSGMFRTRMGVNFKYYLDNIRISRAMELLLTTDMSVTEISYASGYENIRTFNNVFKRITGVVPTDMKKKEY
jgi:AraC-like DNA-binding protein